ncbi:hypothetical protein RG47T_2874 [Mucilaginibacter polytrichastri]|uniref:Uncharacterized protein n=1 Tax=Mucilaginibacter polytrichastri TaxID=1302689 RepID=A0A1Q6A081_9SPHI|nr:hypothetical protein RG47T_2874 [Mucilaginibacter polytrichastri]
MFPKVYLKVISNSGNNLMLMIVATSYWYFGTNNCNIRNT